MGEDTAGLSEICQHIVASLRSKFNACIHAGGDV